MRVYTILLAGKAHPVFYSEIPVELERGQVDEQGRPVRGRAERWLRCLRASLYKAVRRSGPRVKRVWNWLNRRPPPDESLLRVLRRASTLEVVHPSALGERSTRQEWKRYLRKRWREHLITFAWDLLILPLVGLLMVVPGPNVIGYWFVYRILSHLLAMRGVARVRLGWVPTTFTATGELDVSLSVSGHQGDPIVSRVTRVFGLNHLGLFLSRISERGLGSCSGPVVSEAGVLTGGEVSLRDR